MYILWKKSFWRDTSIWIICRYRYTHQVHRKRLEPSFIRYVQNMQKYVQVAFESRWLNPNSWIAPMCEVCWIRRALDVDHIRGRWGKTKKLLLEPSNLIFVCRDCHINKWWFQMKTEWSEIVAKKININTDMQA